MIKRFKDFDVESFTEARKALKESIDEDDKKFDASDMEGMKPVYTDPYLKKIASIVKKRLDSVKIGKFGINYSIVYLNGVPGVWFYGLDDNKKNIVCCRDVNGKTISVFDTFKMNATNVAKVTYSTKKLGFKDMIDELVFDLEAGDVNESVVNEARYSFGGDGYSDANIANFKKLDPSDRKYIYDLVASKGKGGAKSLIYGKQSSGDSDIIRILSIFVGGKPSSGEGAARYLVGLANDVITKRFLRDDPDTWSDLVGEYSGSGPIITSAAGVAYEVVDDDGIEAARAEELRKRKERELAENAEEYRETLEEMEAMTRAMCHYVKQNGIIDNNDMSAMSKRAYLLTGRGGVGKTHTLMRVLKEENMKRNRDYIIMGSNETTSEALYSVMYQYNGKLIIFDDAPKIFAGEYRDSLWKAALQTGEGKSYIQYPREGSTAVYEVESKYTNRQKMYYAEIGHKSDDDRHAFWQKKAKEYGSDVRLLRSSSGEYRLEASSVSTLSPAEISALNEKSKREWEEEQASVKPLMPSAFIFNGAVIIITNETGDRFKVTMGDANWNAIMTRFEYFNINPSSFALWDEIKRTIMREFNDSSIPDEQVSIPRDMTEEFIDEVDELLKDPNYQAVSYRMLDQFHRILGGDFGRAHWKKKLRRELLTNK